MSFPSFCNTPIAHIPGILDECCGRDFAFQVFCPCAVHKVKARLGRAPHVETSVLNAHLRRGAQDLAGRAMCFGEYVLVFLGGNIARSSRSTAQSLQRNLNSTKGAGIGTWSSVDIVSAGEFCKDPTGRIHQSSRFQSSTIVAVARVAHTRALQFGEATASETTVKA